MKLIFLAILVTALVGCKNSAEDPVDGTEVSENAQSIGDVMASIDEMGKFPGDITRYDSQSVEKMFARYFPADLQNQSYAGFRLWAPEAQAASCSGSTSSGFDTCGTTGANKIVRTFNGCTLRDSISFTGTVTLTWTGAVNCNTTGNGSSITRVPNFTVQGRRSANLAVTKTGASGQVLVRGASANDYTFASDGINRKFTRNGNTIFDHTSSTGTSFVITGASSRAGRVIQSGSLRIKNNVSNVTCTYTANNVTWGTAACNCPTSGSWTGSTNCDDGNGHLTTSTLVINGCGTGKYTEGNETTDVTFDRCGI